MMNPSTSWHTLTVDETVERLALNPTQGLDTASVRERLDQHGENRLAERPPRPKWRLFIDQFKSLLIGVLIGASILAGAIGELKDALVILVVVILNAALGFWQEKSA